MAELIRESHPSWVCGLKQNVAVGKHMLIKSHPSWVCGLKPLLYYPDVQRFSHTLRGCVD